MKVLISHGYGAGWSTWIGDNKEQKIFALTYEPFIAALENNEPLDIEQFEKDFEAKFGPDSYVYTGGAQGLCVYDVDTPFTVDEYDGAETLVPVSKIDYYDPMGGDLV